MTPPEPQISLPARAARLTTAVPPFLLVLTGITALLCWEKQPGVTSRAIASVGMAMLLVSAGGYVLAGGGGSVHHSDGVSAGTSMS